MVTPGAVLRKGALSGAVPRIPTGRARPRGPTRHRGPGPGAGAGVALQLLRGGLGLCARDPGCGVLPPELLARPAEPR
jgi:hypothetical protein